MGKYILTIDQGTTATKVSVYQIDGKLKTTIAIPITQIYPNEGWVEHSPYELLKSISTGIKDALEKAKISPKEIVAVGMDNQGETVIPFNRKDGEPLYNAIVWQDSRTSEICENMKEQFGEERLNQKTGLFFDPYFSFTKLYWLKENVDEVKKGIKRGDVILATSDTWLIHKITGGNSLYTDTTTASRTGIFNINTLKWDSDILSFLEFTEDSFPQVVPSVFRFGNCDPDVCGGVSAPLLASCVDQQASMFGHRCFSKGEAKITYGTGGFLLMNIGHKRLHLNDRIITTIAAGIDDNINYLLDGGVYCVGSCVNWLKNKAGIIEDPEDCDKYALSLNDNGGVYFVPALAGLSLPYWNSNLRGAFIGIALNTGKEYLTRAVLEGIAYRFYEIIELIKKNGFKDISYFSVDGGVSNSNFLMQFQSDITGIVFKRAFIKEVTSLGMFYLASLGAEIFKNIEEIKNIEQEEEYFKPSGIYKNHYDEWKKAVKAVVNFYN